MLLEHDIFEDLLIDERAIFFSLRWEMLEVVFITLVCPVLFSPAAPMHTILFPGHPCIVRSTCGCRRPNIFDRLNIDGLTARAITIQRLQDVKVLDRFAAASRFDSWSLM